MGFMRPRVPYTPPPAPLPAPDPPPNPAVVASSPQGMLGIGPEGSAAALAGSRRQSQTAKNSSQGIATSAAGVLTDARTTRKTLLGQ